MKYRIARVEDTDEMREIHKMIFSAKWPGDDHEFWVAYDGTAVVGFASAVMLTATTVYLSRCAVVLKHQGNGLQQKLIATRLKWAVAQRCDLVVAHVEQYNYASLVALLRKGFRLAYRSQCPLGYHGFHFLWLGTATEPELKAALLRMVTE